MDDIVILIGMAGIGLVALYYVVRWGVRDGIIDAQDLAKLRRTRLSGAPKRESLDD